MRTRASSRAAAGRLAAESLPPDMLRAIALSRKASGAGILVRMLQTCKTWRKALLTFGDGGDEIWQALAYARFPHLRDFTGFVFATMPYRDIYHRQLLGARAPPEPAAGPGPEIGVDEELADYHFSYELWHDGDLIGVTFENGLYNSALGRYVSDGAEWEAV